LESDIAPDLGLQVNMAAQPANAGPVTQMEAMLVTMLKIEVMKWIV